MFKWNVLSFNSMTPSHCRYKTYITTLRATQIFPPFFFFSDRQVSLQNPVEKGFYSPSDTVSLTWWSSQGTFSALVKSLLNQPKTLRQLRKKRDHHDQLKVTYFTRSNRISFKTHL